MPKGKLIAIGGAEDKGSEEDTTLVPNLMRRKNLHFFELGILKRLVQEIKGQDSYIEVITTASSIPEELGNMYIKAFEKVGCPNIGLMNIQNREDAKNPEFIERISKCDGVMMTGGNQLRLTTILGGTEILKIMRQRYRTEDFVVAGTSAGAMAMSNTMIYQGSTPEALIKGEVKITTGLAFVSHVIIDSHFEKRGRFGRLMHAVVTNPSCIGIGLGEDTGVLISNGTFMEAIGSGVVIVVDGHDVSYSNLTEIEDGTPIAMEGIVVHSLVKGNCYDVPNRKFIVGNMSATPITPRV